MQVDIDILVYAVIAALLLGRLWAVLGTRNDNEPQRLNPFGARPSPPPNNDAPSAKQRVVARLQPSGPPPRSLAGGLAQVKALAPTFEEKQFLQEARDIFSSVVGAYASGHLTIVAEFLSPALLGDFQKAVNARSAAGQTAQTRIARIKETEVVAARADDKQAFVTVRFISEQENVLRDAQNAIIGGEEGQYEEVTDTWTFARDSLLPGTKWVVVETRG
jgi:predicted lipid-binding transport protein (Tim44 family)